MGKSFQSGQHWSRYQQCLVCCTGLAAWIADRLYEAGLEDPSGLTDTRLPVAQVGQILATLGVSNLAIAAALSICLQTLWANRKSRRASSAASIRVSEAVAQAVQHVDTRSAAEFRAGKRPASSEHVDTRSAADFRAGKRPASSEQSQQVEAQPEVRSSSQPAASSEPLEKSNFAARVRPEIRRRLQKASEGNRVRAAFIWHVVVKPAFRNLRFQPAARFLCNEIQ